LPSYKQLIACIWAVSYHAKDDKGEEGEEGDKVDKGNNNDNGHRNDNYNDNNNDNNNNDNDEGDIFAWIIANSNNDCEYSECQIVCYDIMK
jgi:hypothetical protein